MLSTPTSHIVLKILTLIDVGKIVHGCLLHGR